MGHLPLLIIYQAAFASVEHLRGPVLQAASTAEEGPPNAQEAITRSLHIQVTSRPGCAGLHLLLAVQSARLSADSCTNDTCILQRCCQYQHVQ